MEAVLLSIVMVFCVFVTCIGYRYALTGLNQNAPFIPIKMTYMYAAVPVSFAIMSYYYLQLVIAHLRRLLKPEEVGS